MARWVLVGSIGAVAGPLVLSGVLHLGGSWRLVFLGLAAVALVLFLAARSVPAAVDRGDKAAGLRHALMAFREPSVLRWLCLLEVSDLLGDVLLSYLALYFTDVAGASPALAGRRWRLSPPQAWSATSSWSGSLPESPASAICVSAHSRPGWCPCVPARPRPWPEAAGSLLSLAVGLIARAAGLGPTFWTMLLAPLALMVLVSADDEAPRRTS